MPLTTPDLDGGASVGAGGISADIHQLQHTAPELSHVILYCNYLPQVSWCDVDMRKCVLVLVLLLSPIDSSEAGMPDVGDTLPYLYSIHFDGTNVFFNDDYAIPLSKWELWSGRNIELKRPKYPRPGKLSCALPADLKKKYRKPYKIPGEVFCDSDRIWFATGSYCSEGLGMQGVLFSYSSSSDQVTEHKGLIPDCESIVRAVRVKDKIWFALTRPGEYGPYEGSGILIYDTKTTKSRLLRPAGLTSAVIHAIAYNPEDKTVWLTTKWGIDRYSIDTGTWEHRYIKPILTPDNRFMTILVEERPGLEHYGMIAHLRALPITDREGFVKTWKSLDLRFSSEEIWVPVKHKKLLPYYIDALDQLDNDARFNSLLHAIASHKGAEDEIRAVLEKYRKRPLTDKRRSTIVRLLEKFGIGDVQAEKDKYFATLRTKFFEQGQGLTELCNFIRENDEYVPRIVEQVGELKIEGRIVRDFLGCIGRPWYRGTFFDAMRPFAIRALSANDPRTLRKACTLTTRYVFSGSQLRDVVAGLLRAAYLTQNEIRTVEDGKECWMHYHEIHGICLDAAHEIANSPEGMDILVAQLQRYPESVSTGLTIASCISGKQFETAEQSLAWWNERRNGFSPIKIQGTNENFVGMAESGYCRPVGSQTSAEPRARPSKPIAGSAVAFIGVEVEGASSRPAKPVCYPTQPSSRTGSQRPNEFDLTK